jgi:hypothetical protein
MAKELWNVSEEPGGGSLRGGPAAQGHVEAPLPQLSPRDPTARRRQPLKLLDSVGISGPQIPGTYLASRCGDRARHDNVTLWGLSMPPGKIGCPLTPPGDGPGGRGRRWG